MVKAASLDEIPVSPLQRGKCANDLNDQYFPQLGSAQIMAREAKAVCNGEDGGPVCPVRAQCLEYALDSRERFGIWGGKSERERAAIAKTRRVEAKKRELELAASRQRRSESAKRAWENRRRKAVDRQSEQVSRSKESSAKQSARGGRAA